jgi:hypothetical protein
VKDKNLPSRDRARPPTVLSLISPISNHHHRAVSRPSAQGATWVQRANSSGSSHKTSREVKLNTQEGKEKNKKQKTKISYSKCACKSKITKQTRN